FGCRFADLVTVERPHDGYCRRPVPSEVENPELPVRMCCVAARDVTKLLTLPLNGNRERIVRIERGGHEIDDDLTSGAGFETPRARGSIVCTTHCYPRVGQHRVWRVLHEPARPGFLVRD